MSWPRSACRCFEAFKGCWGCSTAPHTSITQRGVTAVVDIVDFANDLVQERIDQALAARAAFKPAMPSNSSLFCDGCGGAIPEARRLALQGCTHCVTCQSFNELREARYAR
ncbi:TraR/DksA family transcriptional regulator [Pseudomonas brassicacearum]|uniref:TraR/DksA family transcriptional regulator n=1 Tax=Pseudomonas brassicacearum TaxID=930166 RepID=UPI00352D8C70